MQILELTSCRHVGLFVHSHPKFTCQNTRNQWVAYPAALSADKQKTFTQRITNDHVSAAKSRVETREILPPAQTHTID